MKRTLTRILTLCAAVCGLQVFGDDTTSPYGGTIFTFDLVSGQTDLAHSKYTTTTYSNGSFSIAEDATYYQGWSSAATGAAGTTVSILQTSDTAYNTIRFASGYADSLTNPVYTFNQLSLAGIVVESAAKQTGFSSKDIGYGRAINYGKSGLTATSTINKDFTISTASANNSITFAGTQTLAVGSGATFTLNAGTGSIINNATLTISGSGTVKLSSAYSGTGTVTVGSGATLDLSGISVTLSSGIQNSGTVKIDSSTQINFTGAAADGYYTIINGGALDGTITLSQITINGKTLGSRQPLTTTSGVKVAVETASTLVWAGSDGNNTWSTTTTDTPWTGSTYFINALDSVTFGSDATYKTVTVSGTVQPVAMTLHGEYAFNGDGKVSVTDDTLTMESGDSITLGDNTVIDFGSKDSGTFSDTQYVKGTGTIAMSSTASGHGVNATLNKDFTGTLEFHGQFNPNSFSINNTTAYTLYGSSSWGLWAGSWKSITIDKPVRFGGDYKIYLNDGSATFNGTVTQDAGTLYLNQGSNTATFNGKTSLKTVKVTTGSLTLKGETTADLINGSGGTINVNGKLTTTRFAMALDNANSTLNVGTDGVLNIQGTQTANHNNYSPAYFAANWGQATTTDINGTFNLPNAGISVRDGAAKINVNNGGELNLGKGFTYANNTANATITMAEGSRMNIGENGMADNSLGLVINGGTIGSLTDSWMLARALTLNGATTIDTAKREINTDGKSTAVENGTSTIIADGVITSSDAAGDLTKAGAGTLALTAANKLTGFFKIDVGKVLVGPNNATGQASTTAVLTDTDHGVTAMLASGAELEYHSSAEFKADVLMKSGSTFSKRDKDGTVSGDVYFGIASDYSGTGDKTYDAASTVNLSHFWGGKTLTFSGNVVGTGTANFKGTSYENGTATYVLSGSDNTFNGNYAVGESANKKVVLRLASEKAAAQATVTTSEGATLSLGASAVTIAGLGGTAGSVALASGTTASTLTVNQTAETTYAGTIAGAITLVKSGAGKLTLSGANTYTGGTTISAGELVATTSDAVSGLGTVTFTGAGLLTLPKSVTAPTMKPVTDEQICVAAITDDTITYTSGTPVATVGETKYSTFAAAVTAANGTETIVALANGTISMDAGSTLKLKKGACTVTVVSASTGRELTGTIDDDGVTSYDLSATEVYYTSTATEWDDTVQGSSTATGTAEVTMTKDMTVIFAKDFGPVYINSAIKPRKIFVKSGYTLKPGYWSDTSSLPSDMVVEVEEGGSVLFENWANDKSVNVPSATFNGEGTVSFGPTITSSSSVTFGTVSGSATITVPNGITVNVSTKIENDVMLKVGAKIVAASGATVTGEIAVQEGCKKEVTEGEDGSVTYAAVLKDENGLIPYHWYDFNGNKDSKGEASIGWENNSAITINATGTDGENTAITGVNTWSGSGMVLGNGDYTIVVVGKMGTKENGVMFDVGDNNSSQALAFISLGSTTQGVKVQSSNSTVNLSAEVSDATTAFHQYALVKSGTTYTLYVDGVQAARQPDVNFNVGQGPWQLSSIYGSSWATQDSTYILDDFRVYHQVLTEQQLVTIAGAFGLGVNTWENKTGDLKWSTADNWSKGAVPTAGEDFAICTSGATDMIMDASETLALGAATIYGSGKLTCNKVGDAGDRQITCTSMTMMTDSYMRGGVLCPASGAHIEISDGKQMELYYSGSATVSGIYGGTFKKSNGGTLTINNKSSATSDYALKNTTLEVAGGTVRINNGTGSDTGLGDARMMDATIKITGGSLDNYGGMNFYGSFVIENASDATVFHNNEHNAAAAIGGNATFTKKGAGTLVLNSSLKTTGLVTVEAGTLLFDINKSATWCGSPNLSGGLAGAGNFSITNAAYNVTNTIASVSLTGSMNIGEGIVLAVPMGADLSSASSLTLDGKIVITGTPVDGTALTVPTQSAALTTDKVAFAEATTGKIITYTTSTVSLTTPVAVTVPTVTDAEVSVTTNGEAVAIKDGKYYVIPGSDVKVTYTAAEGYLPASTVIELTDVTEATDLTEDERIPTITLGAAKIGSGETAVAYDTLEKAFAAVKDGETIIVLKDADVTKQIEIADKSITLELNGKTIKYTGADFLWSGVLLVHNGAALTVQDSPTTGGGKITSALDSNDTLTAYAAIALTKSGDVATKLAKVVVDGGTLEGLCAAITGNGKRPNTEIIINGGTLIGTSTKSNPSTGLDYGMGIYNPQTNSVVTIKGGTITGYASAIEMRGGTLSVEGGTLSETATEYIVQSNNNGNTTVGAAVSVAQHSTKGDLSVSITGGTLTGVKAVSVANPKGNKTTNVSVALGNANYTGGLAVGTDFDVDGNSITLDGASLNAPEGCEWNDEGKLVVKGSEGPVEETVTSAEAMTNEVNAVIARGGNPTGKYTIKDGSGTEVVKGVMAVTNTPTTTIIGVPCSGMTAATLIDAKASGVADGDSLYVYKNGAYTTFIWDGAANAWTNILYNSETTPEKCEVNHGDAAFVKRADASKPIVQIGTWSGAETDIEMSATANLVAPSTMDDYDLNEDGNVTGVTKTGDTGDAIMVVNDSDYLVYTKKDGEWGYTELGEVVGDFQLPGKRVKAPMVPAGHGFFYMKKGDGTPKIKVK